MLCMINKLLLLLLLRDLQNAVQEQLHKRDEERERNITK